MLAIPRNDRRRYVTKRDLVKCGYTDECRACTELSTDMHNAQVLHDDRCRDCGAHGGRSRSETSRASLVTNSLRGRSCAFRIDVSESTVDVDVPPARPAPTYQEGGSSGSRANEINTDHLYLQRVKFAETRGQQWQGEDVEEVEANAEEQHLNADVEVACPPNLRGERCRKGGGSQSARSDADGGKADETAFCV